MNKFLSVSFLLSLAIFALSQSSFEGSFAVEYKKGKGKTSGMEIKVKDSLVLMKSTQGGNPKYDFYLLNLTTRDFYTVSTKDKKTIIKYNIDSLMRLYEENELKEGFETTSGLVFKPTDKTKDENGYKQTKYVADNEIHKASFWLATSEFNFNRLIPVLRLLGCWNEAQVSEGIILSAEVSSKVSKRESTVLVSMKKEPVSTEILRLPSNYVQKDFAKLMQENKDNKDLKTLIQTFASF